MQTVSNQDNQIQVPHSHQLAFDSPPELLDELKKCATALSDNLKDNNYQEATDLIEKMIACRDNHMYQAIGKLTRGLHDSIVNFNVDGGKKCDVNDSDCDFNDASNRLNYVLDLTKNAAEKTMDMVEESAPLSLDMRQEAIVLKSEWSRLKSCEIELDEFKQLYNRIEIFFDQVDVNSAKINDNFQNIILEQGFQDLTGQVLKRVIELITSVEENLVDLVRIASQVEQVVGINPGDYAKDEEKIADIVGEGPQVKAQEREDVVTSQDEVDDLLSSLGF